jgi:hypothetical protein
LRRCADMVAWLLRSRGHWQLVFFQRRRNTKPTATLKSHRRHVPVYFSDADADVDPQPSRPREAIPPCRTRNCPNMLRPRPGQQIRLVSGPQLASLRTAPVRFGTCSHAAVVVDRQLLAEAAETQSNAIPKKCTLKPTRPTSVGFPARCL